MKNNNICVVTAQKFPSGLASNNRILSYAKGMVELDYKVDVLALAHSDDRHGTISRVNYYNLGQKWPSKIITVLQSMMHLFYVLLKGKYNFLILVSNNALLIMLLFIICKLKGIKYIQEKSEFPFVLTYKGFIKRQFAALYIKFIYKLFDGMIIMTNPLLDYFKLKTKRNCKLLLMPMTVDVTRFDDVPITDEFLSCITYCGYMGGNKDGVKNLIEAFSMIKDKYPNIKLMLLGSAQPNELNDIIDYANNLAPNRVIFKGDVSREKIPYYLKNSKILALARPQSLQSTGGFPTKLGEYLATGKPVLVTAVGDIPNYINHKQHAFIVKPDHNSLFADELSYIIDNYEDALEIAKVGYHLTLNIFNYKKQAIKLANFLNTF